MADPNPSLPAYPELPESITAAVLKQFFTPRPDEVHWVWGTSSSAEARLGLEPVASALGDGEMAALIPPRRVDRRTRIHVNRSAQGELDINC
jgi:hypothetical protein